jgi:cysteine-rich repeat protein
MERGIRIALVLCFILIASISFVSAGFFSDFWGRITGAASCGDGTCEVPGETSATCPQDCGGVSEAVCGNGITESGEQCDDGNAINDDACNNNCSITSCTDSDGGSNYDTKGTASNSLGTTRTDTCYTSISGVLESCSGGMCKLEEFICGDNNQVYVTFYVCPNGCLDGACVSEQETPECTDSDRGINIYEKGSCTSPNGTLYVDYCFDLSESPHLYEYSCSAQGECVGSNYQCTYGCSDGACVEREEDCILNELEVETCSYEGTDYIVRRGVQCNFEISYGGITEEFKLSQFSQITLKNGFVVQNVYPCNSAAITLLFSSSDCIDSDGGNEIYTKGQVYSYLENNVFWDICDNERASVSEVVCNADGSYERISSSCSNGCFNGACIIEGATCVDSDGGGPDYYERDDIYYDYGDFHKYGEVTIGGVIVKDYCPNEVDYIKDNTNYEDNTLIEMFCDEDPLGRGVGSNIKVYDCPNGCEDGACLRADFNFTAGGANYIELDKFELRDGVVDIPLLYGYGYYEANNTFVGIGKDANNRLVTAPSGSNLTFDKDTDDFFVASWASNNTEAESYVIRPTNFITDNSVNKVDFQYLKDGVWTTFKTKVLRGDVFSLGSLDFRILDISNIEHSVVLEPEFSGSGTSFGRLHDLNGNYMELPLVSELPLEEKIFDVFNFDGVVIEQWRAYWDNGRAVVEKIGSEDSGVSAASLYAQEIGKILDLEAEEEELLPCTDTDGGKSYIVKGDVVTGYGEALGDLCVGSGDYEGQLLEFYCGNEETDFGNTLTFEFKDCSDDEGFVCSRGKCRETNILLNIVNFIRDSIF